MKLEVLRFCSSFFHSENHRLSSTFPYSVCFSFKTKPMSYTLIDNEFKKQNKFHFGGDLGGIKYIKALVKIF